ncbi:MAG: protein-L-isoaspartate(D-aspartate) O-methyltransferase [Planctomycetota bacterium]
MKPCFSKSANLNCPISWTRQKRHRNYKACREGTPRSRILACLLCFALSFTAFPAVAQEELTEAEYTAKREEMVRLFIKGAGIKNERVIQSMLDTPRHEFVPKKDRSRSYLDAGLPIGDKQTISSPFIVAFMTEALDPQPTDKVLEIGTGSGFQAAVLSPLVKEVYSIEIVETLGKNAEKVLKKLNYDNVFTKVGDGYLGWAEHAPFDKIIVTCSPEEVPQPLQEQLAEGGVMVVPVGKRHQQTLYMFRKKDGKLVPESLRPTLFVPMTGQAEDERKVLPDPANPKLLNAGFEEGTDKLGFVNGWYYDRQVTWRSEDGEATDTTNKAAEDKAAEGKAYIEMFNDVPGQAAHLLQGLAIDGRSVSKMRFGGMVKYKNVQRGLDEEDQPYIALTFYDKNRKEISTEYFGPFLGNQASWKSYQKEIRVPVGSREAILRIGLFGATGKIYFDKLMLEKID